MLWATKPDGFLAMYGDTFGNSLNQDKQTIEMNLPIGSAFYPKSGYYYRNHANGDGAIWCSFRAGYSSKTHKHADDCSFQLYALGQDIFVDSGMYNYMTGNVYRDYMVSSKAHNSIIVDGNSYSVTAENSSKTGILKTAQTNEYDDIQSKEIHNYEQLFHLYPGIRILEQSNSEVSCIDEYA